MRSIIYGDSNPLALTATQTFARIGYQADKLQVLSYAFRMHILSEDSYAQELALGLPFSPPSAQVAAATTLNRSNNLFGTQVLALTLNTPGMVDRVTPAARATILAALERHEPTMPFALGVFGVNDGGRYADWLNSVALLYASDAKRTYASVVLAHLNAKDLDPRKIIGYLTSTEGRQLMRDARFQSQFANCGQRAIEYAAQFPDHAAITPAAQDIQQSLATTTR